ncbi:MAG TPA: hypothetical protein VK753_09890 [Xanthomonadaceae bacterium]|nr:hypothetical protein [Xanthomonadaceae bacterium]
MTRTRLELHTMICDLEEEVSTIAPYVSQEELMEFFADQTRAIEDDVWTAEDLIHVRKRLRRILTEQGLMTA